jgi:hypothetical protein
MVLTRDQALGEQANGGRGEGSDDLRFTHAVGGSYVVLPFAVCFSKRTVRWARCDAICRLW